MTELELVPPPARVTQSLPPRQRDPYYVEGPALISFSGGRTSGYMLRLILDRGLQPDVHVVFANTGKERSETLDFVRECGERWGVPIHWLEWDPETRFREVTWETASRKGEPFTALIHWKQYLPNPVTRFCTTWLKLVPIWAWGEAQGFTHWNAVIGIRADEPRRVGRIVASARAFEDVCLPLYDAGVTRADVLAWWAAQPFDLGLRDWEGNCDLCFLKGTAKRLRIIQDRPDLAEWWVEQEREIGGPFRAHSPSYAQLVQLAERPPLFEMDDTIGDCFCTD